MIMESILNLYRFLKIKVNPITVTKFSKLMQRSNSLQSILSQINQQINKLDDILLKDLIDFYFLTEQHPKSKIVSNTFNELSTRLSSDHLELDAILEYLIIMKKYVFRNLNAIDQYFHLYESYLNVCKNRMLGGEFNFNQQTIIKIYSVFLNAENDKD